MTGYRNKTRTCSELKLESHTIPTTESFTILFSDL